MGISLRILWSRHWELLSKPAIEGLGVSQGSGMLLVQKAAIVEVVFVH